MRTSWINQLNARAKEEGLYFPSELQAELRFVAHTSNSHTDTQEVIRALVQSALADMNVPRLSDMRDAFGMETRELRQMVLRWTGKSVRGNNVLEQALESTAKHYGKDSSIGIMLRAAVRLFRLGYAVNHKQPHNEHTPLRSGTVGNAVYLYLIVCRESARHDSIYRDRALEALIKHLTTL